MTEEGRAFKTILDNFGAVSVFTDNSLLPNGLREIVQDSDALADDLHKALESGIGDLYLPLIKQNSKADSSFRLNAVNYLVKNGLSELSSIKIVGLFDEMLGWDNDREVRSEVAAIEEKPAESKIPKKCKKGIIIALIAVVALIAGGVAAFFLLPRYDMIYWDGNVMKIDAKVLGTSYDDFTKKLDSTINGPWEADWTDTFDKYINCAKYNEGYSFYFKNDKLVEIRYEYVSDEFEKYKDECVASFGDNYKKVASNFADAGMHYIWEIDGVKFAIWSNNYNNIGHVDMVYYITDTPD